MEETTEIRHLPPTARAELCQILSLRGDWKQLMGNITRSKDDSRNKYTVDHIRLIEEESLKGDKLAMDILIDEWGTSGRARPTVRDLWELCAELDLRRACDYIACTLLGREEQEHLSDEASWTMNQVGGGAYDKSQQPCHGSDMSKQKQLDFNTATDPELNRALDPLLDSKEISAEIAAEIPQFTFSFLEAVTNSFSEKPYSEGGNKIGAGAFGSVYYARLSGQLGGIESVVVKKLSRKAPKADQQFKNEVEMMSLVEHPHILKLLAYSNDGEELCLLYPLMVNGNLGDKLALKTTTTPLSPIQRLKITSGLAKGIAYLHERSHTKPLVHRDIKPENILLDDRMEPKIADFGLIRLAECGEEEERGSAVTRHTTTVMGTDVYMAPEAFRGEITTKLDVYSFGMVLLELLTSLPAYDDKRAERSLLSHIEETSEEDITPLLDSTFSLAEWRQVSYRTLFTMAIACLASNKNKRPRMADICDQVEELF